MRKTFADIFKSIQLFLSMINRLINSADAVVETLEANAIAYRDEELQRLATEALERNKDKPKAKATTKPTK